MKKINWKYPVQEITIIIVGILLALGINNWWNERADSLIAIEYLKALKEDVRIDIENIKKYNVRSVDMIEKPLVSAIHVFLRNDPDSVVLDDWLNDIQMATYMNIFPLRKGTYEDLKSTGNLRLLKNRTLKNELHDYFEKARYYDMYYETFLDGKISALGVLRRSYPLRFNHHDVDFRDKFGPDEKTVNVAELLENTELENTLYSELVVTRWIQRSMNDMLERAIDIDSILTNEL